MSETPAEGVTFGDVVTAAQPVPSLGRIVHYTLNERDIERIVADRMAGKGIGNTARAGEHFPAMIVQTFLVPRPGGGAITACNLQVFLDGDHTLWAQSRLEGTAEGEWSWPNR